MGMIHIIKETDNSLDQLINRISKEYEVQSFDYYDAIDYLTEFKKEGAVTLLEYKAASGISTEFVDVANALLNYHVRPILLVTDIEGMDAEDLKDAAIVLTNVWSGNENDSMGYQVVYYDEANDVSFRDPEGPKEEGITDVLDAIEREDEWPYMGD
ncbi:MAG: hypothetical protein IKN74_00045 [Clostridia bacterium]|nr:hypothetical protein [Clostridia bacterium]